MKRIILFVMVIMVSMTIASSAMAVPKKSVAGLKWDAPNTYTDGSVLDPTTDLSGYNVYYGETSPPVSKITVTFSQSFPAIATGLTYTVTGLTPGKLYYFNVTSVDTFGQESGASNVVVKQAPLPPAPSPPRNLSGLMAFAAAAIVAFLMLIFV